MGLLVLKGLLDNVLSDYLWARAVLLTSPTVATCGTTIQARADALPRGGQVGTRNLQVFRQCNDCGVVCQAR